MGKGKKKEKKQPRNANTVALMYMYRGISTLNMADHTFLWPTFEQQHRSGVKGKKHLEQNVKCFENGNF